MSIFGRLLGTEKALEAAVRGVSNGIDALVYTEQERAAEKAKALTEARSVMIAWLEASSGSRVARRVLAIMIASTWLFQYLTAMLLNVLAIWMPDPARVQQSATLIGDYADSMTGAMMLILTFYFAAPHLGEVVGSALARFGSRPGVKNDPQ